MSDLLLESLVYLSKYMGAPKSKETITAGLAYADNDMSVELFEQAAENIGFDVAIIQQKCFTSLGKILNPHLIFLKDEKPILILRSDEETAQVYDPQIHVEKQVSLDSIAEDFGGFAVSIKPKSTIESEHQDHWFWSIIYKSGSVYAMVILASLFINLFALISPLFIMNVYDRVIPNNAIETGWALGIGVLIAFIFDFVFRTIRGYLIDFAGKKTDILAANKIYDHVINMNLAGRPASSGGFANTLRDFDSVREFFTSATITVLVDLPFTLFFLFFIYRLGGNIALLIVGLIAVVLVIGLVVQKALKKVVRSALKAAQTRHGLLVETINGLETIKANHADGRFRARYAGSIAEDATYAQKSRALSSFGVNVATFIQQTASVFIILAGMYLVQSGDLSTGGLIACVILSGRALAPIGQIANLMAKYHQAGGALKSLDKIMSASVERPKGKTFLHRPSLLGEISFEHVSFAYPGTDLAVIKDMSFTIKPGERVGIIGRVGSGKSTIAKLILRLYEPQNGVMLADGTDYRQIDPADLRSNMAYISQETFLFQGTVRDNITASKPQTTDEEVLACAKACGVDEFIARHPMGYNAPVGERGAYFSGGQRQAIALARAVITGPNIFVCDEPTSAMDSQAEESFTTFMEEQTRGKTFILITHKQSMMRMVDRLILLHQGKIMMDAPRDDVLSALQSATIKAGK